MYRPPQGRPPPALSSYLGHLSREQIRELIALGHLRRGTPNSPDWPLTELYGTHPPPPMQESDWGPDIQDHQRNLFRARVMREGLEDRHTHNAQERAQREEWACFPDPLVRLFLPQFKLMAARGLESIQHTLDHVHLRIQEVAEALQRQAHADPPVYDELRRQAFLTLNLTDPLQRTALAAYLTPIYERYEQHLRTREMEYLASLTSVKVLQYRWLLLHRFLVEHGFTEESVDEFIAQQQHLDPDAREVWNSPLVIGSSELERRAAALDPALRQFRANRPPAHRLILDQLNANGARVREEYAQRQIAGSRDSAP
jgi:hypothetical protein